MAIDFFHGDCMDFMRDKPNGFYDLAIVDPPYGGSGKENDSDKISMSRRGGTWATKYGISMGGGINDTPIETWDYAPPKEYFDELFRVSKNQIIWGGNYFNLPPCRCFIIWKKLTISEKFTMAMAEYAWTSFNKNAKVFECAPQGKPNEPRFHLAQKPVRLYKWCLNMFAEKGWKLLDTHGGSMSSAVAASELGFDMDICEINDFYFTKGKERVEKSMKQLNLPL
jgi:site-specific DNA-methyltransferase (adenine-specific)